MKIARGEEVSAIGERLERLPERVVDNRVVEFGRFQGLESGVNLSPHFSPDVYVRGKTHRSAMLSRSSGPRAMLNAMIRIVSSYADEVVSCTRDLKIAESQLTDFQQRLGRPFEQEAYAIELSKLRDQPKDGLSLPPAEDRPSVSELADRIKALRAGQVVEEQPERSESRTVSAE